MCLYMHILTCVVLTPQEGDSAAAVAAVALPLSPTFTPKSLLQ